jgi:hypothetical protein
MRSALLLLTLTAVGCSRTSTSTVGPFVRHIEIDRGAVNVTTCPLILDRSDGMVEVRPHASLPGASSGTDLHLHDGACSTAALPRPVGAR